MMGAGLLTALTLSLGTACSEDNTVAVGAAGNAGASGAGEGGAAAGEGGAGNVQGALIHVTASSKVGVLLDEIPPAMRDRVAKALLAKPDSFYEARAKRQLALATYRLNFRAAFYPDEKKQQLPLPPESVLGITLVPSAAGKTAYRTMVNGHDYVLADYTLDTTVVTDAESPGISEPTLADIGGTWQEPFVFPVDPELLVQRTGYACMDEADFPPNSVDTEDVQFFYDQECDVESELSTEGCHLTQLPESSCADALDANVGKVEAPLQFERIAWDEAIARSARVGKVETQNGADLSVVGDELLENRLTYRYITKDACSLAEQCVGGTGWRRLLQFNASEKNVGTEPVNIGDVNYYLDDALNDNPNANHHVYEYSECHHHYHFNHFATFTYGDDPSLGSKRAFCLQSVARYANHESSPTWSDYGTCAYQGITQGWGDQYNAGIECQWVDVTTIDTSRGAVTKPLGLRSNPDGFLCEGKPVLNAAGEQVWEPTAFKTDAGETVDRAKCDFSPDYEANDFQARDVRLPVPGEGMITEPCDRGQLGPKRNCGFSYEGTLHQCTPGETVALHCSIKAGVAPQVLRVCEGSTVLGAGVACVDSDALASALPTSAGVPVTFVCPAERDNTEPGGQYALYSGAIWTEDENAAVTCTVD